MATYRIFLRTADEPVDLSTDAVCDSDRAARDLAQRMLEDGSDGNGQVEVWAGPRFVGIISAMSVEGIAKSGQAPEL